MKKLLSPYAPIIQNAFACLKFLRIGLVSLDSCPSKKSYTAAFLSDKRDFQHCGSAFFTQMRYTKQLR